MDYYQPSPFSEALYQSAVKSLEDGCPRETEHTLKHLVAQDFRFRPEQPSTSPIGRIAQQWLEDVRDHYLRSQLSPKSVFSSL